MIAGIWVRCVESGSPDLKLPWKDYEFTLSTDGSKPTIKQLCGVIKFTQCKEIG